MRIRVTVEAGARRERVNENKSGGLDIAVREEARGNAANRRIVALIAARYGVPQKSVRIVKGHRASSKTLEF